MKKLVRWFGIVAVVAATLALVVPVLPQNPQTQTAPLFATNAKYTNGVAPGYWPTQLAVGSRPAQTGLNINVGPGTVNCGSGTIVAYAGGTFTLTASATNRIYLNTASSCAPTVKTTAFVSADIPIAVVVTGGSTITSVTDDRTPFTVPPGTSSVAWGSITGTLSDQSDLNAALAAKAAASSVTTINGIACALNGSCSISAGSSSFTLPLSIYNTSSGMALFADSTSPGGVIVIAGPPVNGVLTNQCPGPGAGDTHGLAYIDSSSSPYKIYTCSQTLNVWVEGLGYASTSTMLFQNYNQQSKYVIGGPYFYPGIPYTNDSGVLNTGNATTADVAAIEVYPNEAPPDDGAPDYYTQSGIADVFNCAPPLFWVGSWSDCDKSVRGPSTAMWSWLGSSKHGKILARNAVQTGTWTNYDPPSHTTTATWTAGATTITVASATGIAYGQHLVDNTNGVAIPTPVVVTAVSGTTITLNKPMLLAGTGDSVTFWTTATAPFTPGVAVCGTTGATLTFSTMPSSGNFYLSWIVTSGGTDTATLSIDGGTPATLSSGVMGAWSTTHITSLWYGDKFAMTGIKTHTAVVTVTAGSFCPLFAVTPKPNGWFGSTQPNVYAGIAPPDSSSGYSSSGNTVRNAQVSVTSQMQADGFHLTPVDFFKTTWPEGTGTPASTLYCEFNFPCNYPGTGIVANQGAGPHYNRVGNTFNYDAFVQKSGRTQVLVGDVDGQKKVVGLYGTPFCIGFAPAIGQRIALSGTGTPVPCWDATTQSGVTWNGAWSGSAGYSVGDMVSYLGVGYINIVAVPAPGTPTFIQSLAGDTTSTFSTVSPVTAGHVLLLSYECRSDLGLCPPTITDNQLNTWVDQTVTSSNPFLHLLSTTASATGVLTVTTPGGSNGLKGWTFLEFSNVGPTPTSVAQNTITNTPGNWAPTFTVAADSLLFYGLSGTSGGSIAAFGGTTLTNLGSSVNLGSYGGAFAVKTAGTYSIGMSFGNGFVNMVAGAFPVTVSNTNPASDSTHWLALGGSTTTATAVTFNVATGVSASPAAPYLIAVRSGTISHNCSFTTLTSDGSTDLSFNVKFNGTTVLASVPATVTHATSGGTISTFSLAGGTGTITAGQKWELDITGGTTSWTGAVQCY